MKIRQLIILENEIDEDFILQNLNNYLIIKTDNYKKYLKFIELPNFEIIPKNSSNNIYIKNGKFYFENKLLSNLKLDNNFIFKDLKKKQYKLLSFVSSKKKASCKGIENLKVYYKKINLFGYSIKYIEKFFDLIDKNKKNLNTFGYPFYSSDILIDSFNLIDDLYIYNPEQFTSKFEIEYSLKILKNEEIYFDNFISLSKIDLLKYFYQIIFNIINLHTNYFNFDNQKEIWIKIREFENLLKGF